MNGRLFDPTIARMLQADPLVQAPDNLQSYNRYTYCFNNPSTCTDPSGFAGSVQQEILDDNAQDERLKEKPKQEVVAKEEQPGGTAKRDGGAAPSFWADLRKDHQIRNQLANQLLKGLGVEIAYGAVDLIDRMTGTPLPSLTMQKERNPDFWTHPAAPFLAGDGINLFSVFVGARVGGGKATGGAPSLPSFRIGGKTVGVLRTSSGNISLESGWAGPASSVPRGTSGFDIVTRTHVEGHAAAAMRQGGITEGTLHINNPKICNPCTTLLPRMLPPGSKLTVVTPSGSTTFVGVGR
jgi:hypothetical protein